MNSLLTGRRYGGFNLLQSSLLIRTNYHPFSSASSPLPHHKRGGAGGAGSGSISILEAGLGVVARKIVADVTKAVSSLPTTSSGIHTAANPSPTTSSLLLPPSTTIPQSLLSKLSSIQDAISRGYADMDRCRERQCMVAMTSPADGGSGGMSYPRTSLLGLGNPICNAVVYGLYILGHRDASFEIYRAVLELRRTRRELWIKFQPASTSAVAPSDKVNLVEIDAQYGGGLFTFVDTTEEAERLCQTASSSSLSTTGISHNSIAVLTGITLSELMAFTTSKHPGSTTHYGSNERQEDALRRLATTVLLPQPFQRSLEGLLVHLDTTFSAALTSTPSSSASPSPRSNIQMWATGGTALGAIRHSSPSSARTSSLSSLPQSSSSSSLRYPVSQIPPIPWDDDIDFCLMDTQESLLHSILNFPVGILPTSTTSSSSTVLGGGEIDDVSGGGDGGGRDTSGLFLEFCPLFGYKIYPLDNKGFNDAEDISAPTFGQYGCFVDVFLMSRKITTTSSTEVPPRLIASSLDAVISLPFAQQAWPKEVFRNINIVDVGGGDFQHPSFSITPLEIKTTSSSSTLLNHFGVLDGSGGVTHAYLHRTFGGERDGQYSTATTATLPSYLSCGVVPRDQHGRSFSHTIYIPIRNS